MINAILRAQGSSVFKVYLYESEHQQIKNSTRWKRTDKKDEHQLTCALTVNELRGKYRNGQSINVKIEEVTGRIIDHRLML